ncbi:serine/threonine-protein kinase [Anatilimnocola floriformis]|uniref:serine/threonine-protein kinase n=1 Tax=Anatilimnocola floriformis TaxID=2948575 RepID=UPI0020C50069|nr:serine/threonine-protein kinase [Anatilimnocola floriformis]
MPHPHSRHSVAFKVGDTPVPGYRLARELGRGTFGIVWLAVTENGFERALKVVNLEQKGGKKEFRALRLIKDRKILHGNLLTLIDYWLLDRDGTIIAAPNSVAVDTHVVQPKVTPGSGLAATTVGEGQQNQPRPAIQGTMIPSQSPETDSFNIRETFQQPQPASTREDDHSQAIWLVVAMELGHKTLHDRQKEYSHEISQKSLSKSARKGATQVKGATSAGSHTVADRRSQTQAEAEEDVLAALPADEVLPYMEQAARGLDYLHRCEIVHRDIKPQNIMLVGDVAKVCDYGLASELGDIRATTNAFTLPYAAPEAINKNQPSPASDQYSLAVTYVELRTGRWPFVSNTSTAVYAAKDTGVHHLKFVPNRNVRAVLKKALSKKPEDRYPSCGEFVKQLAKAEATRFNFFATAQAVLATFAIVAVLLAASATHPAVWARIKPFLPPALTQPLLTGQGEKEFDVAAYRSRLQSVEQLLLDNKRAEALQAYTLLHQEIESLPPKEIDLRNEIIFGLARAQAGATGALNDSEKRTAIAQLIEPLSTAAALPGKQGLWNHYLQVIAAGKEGSREVGPESQIAKEALAVWERQLWKDALLRHEAPELKRLLDLAQTKRLEGTSESLQLAEQTLTELREKSAAALELSVSLRHQIDVEELHLHYATANPPPAENLLAIKSYLEQELALEQNLVDRVQLLELLTLKASMGDNFYLANDEVAAAVIDLKPELFGESRLESLHFGAEEVKTVVQLRDEFLAEIRQSAVELPEKALESLTHLLPQRAAMQLLAERLRGHLTSTELKENQLPAVQFAWGDFSKAYEQFRKSSGSESDLAGMAQTEADLSLEVSFADPKADPNVALVEFVNRVIKSGDGVKWFQKLLGRAQQGPPWSAAAAIPLQTLLRSPTDDLASHRQFSEWQAKVEALVLRDVLHTDPASDKVIQAILATLSRDAGDGKGPIPSLLRIECEILTTPTPTPEKTQEWSTKIDRALNAIGNSDADLKSYGNFVRSRLLANSGNVFQQEDAARNIGDLLKHRPLPGWFTASRRQGAGDVFAISAIKALKLDDEDILRFADLSPAAGSQLAGLQAVANDAQVQAPALQVVSAIVEARQEKPDWKKVQQWIASGRNDSRTAAMFDQFHAVRLLEYVAALADLRAAPENSPLDPKIVQAFHKLLIAQKDKQFLYFSFAEGSRDNDEGVLQNIINPVVLHPAMKDAKEPPKELAFLWGAKGRLLQRSPLIVNIDPAKQSDVRDSSTVAISLSNQAFDRARALDTNINYLVGYGRTLAAVPAESTQRDDRMQRLYELVDKHDPDGKSTNIGMRFLSAYVLRFRSYDKSDIPNIRLAGTRYEAVLKELPADDPYELNSLCREGLSDIHLRLAFLTPQVTPGEVRTLLGGGTPAVNTKAYHLQLAVKHALEATQSSGRNQKENAYTALANAYEDYAYYLGLTEYYAKSKDAFGFAISSARDRGLPVAKAQMNYGRCLYRYATDPFAGFAKNDERIEILKIAVAQLNEAVESDKLRPSDEVEASFWLAVDKRAIGKLADRAAKLTLSEEALNHFHQAAEAATKHQLPDMQLLTLAEESEAAIDLYSMYTVAKDPIRQPKVFKQAQAIDEQAYQIFLKKPSAANPSQLKTIASNGAVIWRGEAPKRIRWLEGSPAIKAQWNANDNWKSEAITLRLNFAQLPEGKDEIRKAREILATMKDQRQKDLAESRILDFEATIAYRAFEDVASKQKDLTQQELREEVDKPLTLLIAAKKHHDQIMETEPKALLDRINATSLTQLKNLARELTVAEKKKVHEALMKSPDIDTRKRLFQLCNLSLLTQPADAKATARKNELARIGHDALKPFYLFADNELIFNGLRELKDKHQVGLEKFEGQLKVTGDKFDKK